MTDTLYDSTLDAQAKAIKRRRERLAATMADLQGIEAAPSGIASGSGWTSAVTGTPMVGTVGKQSAGPAILSALGQVAGVVGDRMIDRDERTLDRATDADARDIMASVPQETEYSATPLDPSRNLVEADVTPASEPTLRDQLAWAMRAQMNPRTKGLGDAYASDSLIKAPERKENREFRASEAQLAREARAQEQEANRQARADLAAQQMDLRRDLAAQAAATRAAIHAGAGGGKASDFQIITGPDGTIYRVNKLTGDSEPVKNAQGKPDSATAKDFLETRGQIERSAQAVADAPHVDALLQDASASGLKADIRKAAGYVAGYSDKSAQADAQLSSASDTYLKSVPRFEGPQSDADTKSYKEAAGQLANTQLPPPTRRAALKEVVRLHKKALDQAQQRSTFSGDSAARRSGNSPGGAPASPVPAPPALSDEDLLKKYR